VTSSKPCMPSWLAISLGQPGNIGEMIQIFTVQARQRRNGAEDLLNGRGVLGPLRLGIKMGMARSQGRLSVDPRCLLSK